MEEKHIQDALKTSQHPQSAIDKGVKPSQEEGNRTEEGKETRKPHRTSDEGTKKLHLAVEFISV